MTRGWAWWFDHSWLKEVTGVVLALAFGTLMAAGWGRADSAYQFWCTAFLFQQVAIALEYSSGRTLARPEILTGRIALAGTMWAWSGAAWCLVAFDWMVLDRLETDVLVQVFSKFIGIAFIVMTVAAASVAPRPANWVLRFHREQLERITVSERALARARTQVLHAQMQPHFLFNALNTVTALMREDPARGRDVLLRLRGLMERTWRGDGGPTTTVRSEVNFVRDQLAIEQERFRDRLTVTMRVDDEVLDRVIPSFSLQPLVENALRHGIARSIDGGLIDVRVHDDGGTLVMQVRDTGGGLAPGWTEGTGLSNLRERLTALNPGATLTLESSNDITVATVRIVPVQ